MALASGGGGGGGMTFRVLVIRVGSFGFGGR